MPYVGFSATVPRRRETEVSWCWSFHLASRAWNGIAAQTTVRRTAVTVTTSYAVVVNCASYRIQQVTKGFNVISLDMLQRIRIGKGGKFGASRKLKLPMILKVAWLSLRPGRIIVRYFVLIQMDMSLQLKTKQDHGSNGL